MRPVSRTGKSYRPEPVTIDLRMLRLAYVGGGALRKTDGLGFRCLGSAPSTMHVTS